MKLADARAMVPGLRVARAAPEADAATLVGLADWCDRYTPLVAGDGVDGLFLDVTGCAHLFGGEGPMLADLLRRLAGFGYAVRGALADTPGLAWGVARHGRSGRVVRAGAGREALAALPVAALRLDPATVDTLERLGLKTAGSLLDLPRPALAARFGALPGRRLDQALGLAGEPISPRRKAPALRVRLAVAEPVGRREDIAAGLDYLLVELCDRLAETHRGARRLELTLFRTGGGVERLAIGTSAPVRDPGHLARLFAEPLDRLAPADRPGEEIETLVLTAPATAPFAALQLPLTAARGTGGRGIGGRGAGDTVAPLVDRLVNRLGPGSVARLAPVESHVPERAAAARPGLAEAPAADAWRTAPPRPLRLLPRPEPIEVVASVPEGPPALVRWHRQTLRVRRAAGPERIAAEWWRDAMPTRDYYRVEDEDGRRLWIFRAGLYRPDGAPRWYLHGLFA